MNYLDNFKKHLVGNKKSVHTITAYISDIKLALDFIGKNETDIQFMDVDNWKASIINQAPATINRKIIALNRYFDYLIKMKIVSENPADGVENVKHKSVRNKTYIPLDDAKKLIDFAQNDRDKAIISVYLSLGLRVTELCNLTLQNYYDGECDIITKGEVTRHIIFNDSCKKYINKYLEHRYANIPYLFVTNRGTQMSTHSLNNTLKYIAKLAGLPTDICNHSLRHSYSSYICDNYGIGVAQQVLKHSSIKITEKYCHTTNDKINSIIMEIKF